MPVTCKVKCVSEYSFFCIYLAKINEKEVGKTGVEVNGSGKVISSL